MEVKKQILRNVDEITSTHQNMVVKHKGVYVANIDNLGNVDPDVFKLGFNLGSIKERVFSGIWKGDCDHLMTVSKVASRPFGSALWFMSLFDYPKW